MKEIKYSIKKENGEVINDAFKYSVKFSDGVDQVISEGAQDLIAQYLTKKIKQHTNDESISDGAYDLMGVSLARQIALDVNNSNKKGE